MYKYLLSFLIVLVFKTTYLAQVNLVPNGGFEEYTMCPTGINLSNPDLLAATNWSSTINSTVDYLNSCSSNTNVSTPFNYFGFQTPHGGAAYVGLGAGSTNIANIREYMFVNLITNLSVGEKYYIKLNISPTIRLDNVINTFCNRIGVRLSCIQIDNPMQNIAQLTTNSIQSDTVNWIKLFGSFIADSIYTKFYVGNFFDDLNTAYLHLDPPITSTAYFFIDDICISADSAFCNNFTQQSPNAINEKSLKQLRVYPNPIENKIVKLSEVLYNRRIRLIDCKGEVVFGLENYTGKELQLPKELKEGIYNLTIDGFISKRIILLQK